MKKCFKSLISVFVLVGGLFLAPCILAETQETATTVDERLVKIDSEKIENTTLYGKNIIKKETITCKKYENTGGTVSSPYKYVVARIDVAYNDLEGNTIATAFCESIFRYNPNLELCKCLSTSHGKTCSDEKYSIEVECRTKNLSLEVGESFCKMNFYKSRFKKDKSHYIFSCTKDGELYRRLV